MSEAGCTDLYTKLTASTQHGHRVVAFGISNALSTRYNIAMQFHCKSMTEMTCVVANAGSFLPHMLCNGIYMMMFVTQVSCLF